MPKLVEERYRDILKVEFKDMLCKFLEDRELFHIYAIGRTCTQGTLLGFDYHYYTDENFPGKVGKVIDLTGYGQIHFHISVGSQYGKIVNKDSQETLEKFIKEYSTDSSLVREVPRS